MICWCNVYAMPRYIKVNMKIWIPKNGAMAQISINTGTQYDPAGRDTETIYGYAEADGLIGKGYFWERSKEEIPKILEEEIEKRLG